LIDCHARSKTRWKSFAPGRSVIVRRLPATRDPVGPDVSDEPLEPGSAGGSHRCLPRRHGRGPVRPRRRRAGRTTAHRRPEQHRHQCSWISSSRPAASTCWAAVAPCRPTVRSQAPLFAAEAIYLTAHAEQVGERDIGRCADIFRSRLPELVSFGPGRLRVPAPLRLYRAHALEGSHFSGTMVPAFEYR
jgi:hypothetical protein